MKPSLRKNGFTLIEAMTALSITVVAITLAIGSYITLQKEQNRQIAQDKTDTDIRLVAGRMQKEMRLSSLSEMAFFPEAQPRHTGISFPLCTDSTITTNSQGGINWDTTVIYHVSTDGKRLLRTAFHPRDNSLNITERQIQLSRVCSDENGARAANGEHASTTGLLDNVCDWKIVSQGNVYDGYNSERKLDREVNLGSCILTPGKHTLKLTVTGKKSQSSGYALGVDTLHVSSSQIEREAEAQPVSGSPTPLQEYNASGTWSGYHQLTLPATQIGDSMEIDFYNDRWEDTNFELNGCVKSNTTVGALDFSYNPPDLALRLDGNSTNWTAAAQTGDSTGRDGDGNFFAGSIIRTLIRGEDMPWGASLENDGLSCRIAFSASGSQNLSITEAYIDECVSSTNITPDTIGHPFRITFGNTNNITIPQGGTAWSDYLDYPVESEKSYAVTFRIDSAPANACPRIWNEIFPGATGTFMIPLSQAPDHDDLVRPVWASRTGISDLPQVVGVTMLHTTYPASGTFISPVMDTHMEQPNYDSIDWSEDCPRGTRIHIKVRTGSSSNLSDAPSWNSVSTIPSPGSIMVPYERYVQYHVTLFASSDGLATPKLKDIAIQWPGNTAITDIGGSFVNSPEYGQFEALIDNQPLSSPLRISIGAQETVRGQNNTMKTQKTLCNFELTPRNTGN